MDGSILSLLNLEDHASHGCQRRLVSGTELTRGPAPSTPCPAPHRPARPSLPPRGRRLLVGDVLAAVDEGQDDIAQRGQGQAQPRAAVAVLAESFHTAAQVDEVQAAAAPGHCRGERTREGLGPGRHSPVLQELLGECEVLEREEKAKGLVENPTKSRRGTNAMVP